MQIEKVGDSIRDLVEKNEILKTIMGGSDYIIYGYTFLLVLSKFISLGGFVDALLGVLLFPLIILAFAGRKYIGMIVLFSGQAFACLYGFILNIYYLTFTRYFIGSSGNIWENVFGVAVSGLLLWLSIALFLKSRPAKPAPAAPVSQPSMQFRPPVQQVIPPQAAPQTFNVPVSAQPAPTQGAYIPTPAAQIPVSHNQYAPAQQPAVPQTPVSQQPMAQSAAADPYANYRPQNIESPAPIQKRPEPDGGVTPGVVCAQCGAMLPDGAMFCTRCGHKLGD